MNQITKLASKPWIWSYLGALVVWLAAIVYTGGTGAGGMITAAIDNKVYPLPILASAEVVMPISAMPDRIPNSAVRENITTLMRSSDQPARPMACGLPPAPRNTVP